MEKSILKSNHSIKLNEEITFRNKNFPSIIITQASEGDKDTVLYKFRKISSEIKIGDF